MIKMTVAIALIVVLTKNEANSDIGINATTALRNVPNASSMKPNEVARFL